MPFRRKSIKQAGRSLASRLTGVSIPVIGGGINWRANVSEMEIAKRLLTYLEDRRVLFNPYELEVMDHVILSIREIRDRLTSDLGLVSKTSVLGESIMSMRAACRKFLDDTQHPQSHYILNPDTVLSLGELRCRPSAIMGHEKGYGNRTVVGVV